MAAEPELLVPVLLWYFGSRLGFASARDGMLGQWSNGNRRVCGGLGYDVDIANEHLRLWQLWLWGYGNG